MQNQRASAALIAEDLRQRIARHEFDETGRLPSIRELSGGYSASANTVSRALKILCGERLITVREHVGYEIRVPDEQPSKIGIVAVAIGSGESPVWFSMMRGAQDRLNSDQYGMISLTMSNDSGIDRFIENLKRLMALDIKGLIVVPPLETSFVDVMNEIVKREVPLVLADRCYLGFNVPYVVSDNMASAYRLTRMLTAAGHTRIGFVRTNHISTVEERLLGFRQACYESELRDEDACDIYIPMPIEDMRGRFEEFQRLFLEKIFESRVTALFTANDQIASMVMQALSNRGLRVPDDYSLVTFDAHMLMSSTGCRLTGVQQDMYSIGYKCAEALLSRLDGSQMGRGRGYIIPADIVVADSIREISPMDTKLRR